MYFNKRTCRIEIIGDGRRGEGEFGSFGFGLSGLAFGLWGFVTLTVCVGP